MIYPKYVRIDRRMFIYPVELTRLRYAESVTTPRQARLRSGELRRGTPVFALTSYAVACYAD